MRLYAANCTLQYRIINYRVIEANNPFTQQIESGQQQMLGRTDLTMPQVEGIVRGMEIYGMRLVDDLGNINESGQIVWVASIDKPVPTDIIQMVMDHNLGVLIKEGREFRQKAAVATNHVLNRTTPHAADTLEMTIQEESEGSTGLGGEPLTAEGFVVATDQPHGTPRRRSQRMDRRVQ